MELITTKITLCYEQHCEICGCAIRLITIDSPFQTFEKVTCETCQLSAPIKNILEGIDNFVVGV